MSLFFLIVVAAGLPFLSALSYKNIKKLEAEQGNVQLAKTPIYLQSMALQLVLLALAFFASGFSDTKIVLESSFNAVTIGSAAGFLVLALGIAWLSQKYSKQKEESTLHHLLPDTPLDRLMWIIACVVAAFCEEYVYRGSLFQMMLAQTNGIWIAAAVLSSIIFSFGHGTQGEKAILQIIPFALGFHFLVYISGGLLLPMIVHFIYNVLVELLFGRAIKENAKE
ncbi:MAG: CPBP family intramembrane metalloprotease [Chitinophagaceae bacterium]|nr:CPBP family intramembrane metalloprotease [Chitinophagaceae bacterium]